MSGHLLDLFGGLATLVAAEPKIAIARVLLVLAGLLLFWAGAKNILEPLLMIPMGLSMAAVNAGVLFLAPGKPGTLFLEPMVSDPAKLIDIMQIDFLQPVYSLTFGNGLVACLVFMGIGVMTDVGFLLARPFTSMFIAVCAEFGTVATFPIARAMGLTNGEAAAIAMVGGADGPMVLYTSLMLAKHLFVPITIVAYLYLSLTYGGYPFLLRLLVPKKYRGLGTDMVAAPVVPRGQRLAFSAVTCTLLCLLFPVAAPLFLSFFVGVACRDAGLKHYCDLIQGPILYGATFFLGLLLGVLCEARTILDPKILTLFLLGVTSLLLSGIGGIAGGWILWAVKKGKFNPAIGIAGVSCVPTTAKVAQKFVTEENPYAFILPYAIGANISGVITTAILAGVYVTLIPLLK